MPRLLRHALVALVALAASAVVLVPGAAAQDPPGFGLDLAGDWKLQTGDDPAWADPDFDDSDWMVVQAPADDQQGVFADYDGFAWFRKTFEVPVEADGLNLVAAMGFIDDADETYVNGQVIGSTGEFPPDEDSQWFEQRLYPVPAGVLRPGELNTIAVRMNDFTGGGGWYRGPIGLFSKERLRVEVHGITAPPAPGPLATDAQALLATQAAALASGDAATYLSTLDPSFFHDGDTLDRRRRDVEGWLARFDGLELRDNEVEVLQEPDGTIVVDTNRELVGISGSDETVLRENGQDFLRLSPDAGRELGNRSRFFRDSVDSQLEGQRREFVVYLPPSYLTDADRSFPTVWLFHGINGGAREWEPRDMRQRIDALIADEGLAEMVVVFPDGESLWYIDSSVTPWRSMFTDELMPLVEAEYRVLADRLFRGTMGVSMGGHGAFTVGWDNPDLFSSIASHMGALDFPPLVGGPDEIAANSPETPTVQVQGHTPEFLSRYRYFFDACADDDFRFGEAVRMMEASLTAKGVEHTAVVYPEGRHDDACWVPRLGDSFGMHSASFRANGLQEPAAPGSGPDPQPDPDPDPQPDPAPDPQPDPAPAPGPDGGEQLPATGGGAGLVGVALLAAGARLRRRAA